MGAEMDSLELSVDMEAKGANRSLTNMERKLTSIGSALEKIQSLLPSLGKVGDIDALAEVRKATADIEKNINGVNKRKIKPRVDRSDLKYAYKDLDAIFEKFKDIGSDTKVGNMGMPELRKKIQSTEKEVDRLNSRLDKKLDTENVDKYGKSYVSLVYDIQRATNALEVYKNAMATLKGKVPDIKIDRGNSTFQEYKPPTGTSSGGGYNPEAMKMVYGEGAENIKDYSDAVKKLGGNASEAMSKLNGMDGAFDTNKIVTYEGQIKSLKSELASLAGQGFSQGDPEYDRIAQELAEVTEAKKLYNKEMRDMARSELGIDVKPAVESLNTLEGKLAQAKKDLNDIAKQGYSQGSTPYDTKAKEVAEYTERIKQYNKALKDSAKQKIASDGSPGMSRAAKALKNASDKAKQFSSGLKSGMSTLKKYASTCGTLGGVLAKPIAMIGKLTGSIAGLRNQTNKGMSWGRMIGSSILFSTVFGMISAIKQALAEGSNNLVQYSSVYNNSISSIVTSLLYLKNAWAAAFSPIVNVVAPYLSKFIDMMASVLNKVGQFFSVLTGKSMAVQAKKVWKDYGRTLVDTGSSAKKAASGLNKAKKAAKEFQTYTLGIDELNVQPKATNSSENTGTGGTGGSSPSGGKYTGPDPSTMFETIKPEKAISDYAKRLRAAFKAHDWKKLGAIMAEGVNAGMLKLYKLFDWNKNGKKVTYFINAFTETMNSFVDHIDWALMGGTVAAGVNTLVNSFNLLTEKFDFTTLGANVGLSIMNAIRNINWTNFGRAIGNYFMVSWRFFVGMLRQIQFDEVGLALAKAFNGALGSINLGMVGETIGRLVGGIITMIKTFIANADWSEVGTQLKEGIKNIFKYASNGGENNGIIGAIIGVGAVSGVLKAVAPIAKVLEVFDKFKSLGVVQGLLTKVGSLIANIVPKVGALSTTASELGAVVSSLPVGVVVAAIALVTAGLVNLWQTSATFRDNIKTFASMIANAVLDAKKLMWDDTILPLWDNLKSFFASLVQMYESTGLKDKFELLATIISGALATSVTTAIRIFSNWFKTMGSVFSGLLTSLTGIIKFLTGVFTGNWKLAWDGVKKIVDGIVKAITGYFSGMWKTMTSIFEPASTFFKVVFTKAYSNIKTFFSPTVNFMKGVWKDIKDVFDGVPKWFDGIFKDAANAIVSRVGGAINTVIKGINWVLGKLGSKKKFTMVSLPKFATGTNGVPQDMVGVVNDQPGNTYKEMIVPPSGKPFIPEGRNVVMPLERGTKILPANKTKALTENVPHFKKGIGDFISGAWEKAKDIGSSIFEYASHPSKLLQIALNKFVDTSKWAGAIGDIAGATVNTIYDSAKSFIKGKLKALGSVGLEKAVNWAVNVANDNSHGYDQAKRWGTPDYDCSSLVISAFEQAGIHLKKNGAWTTSNLLPAALKSGFKDVTSAVNLQTGKGMKRGDILLKKGHHVALYMGGGKMVQARINEKGTITGGKPGDQTGKEIMVGPYANFKGGWSNILRYTKGFAKGIGTIGISDLPKYSTGGFPEDGLFMANKREILGQFDGKNAVVNNYQIEAGIEEATYRGYKRAQEEANNNSILRDILAAIKEGKSIQIDGREIVRAYDSRKKRNGFSFT